MTQQESWPLQTTSSESVDEAWLRSVQIGRLCPVSTPMGQVPLVYCDWTASGRALSCVERLVSEEVLELYGNTHTAASACGAQSSAYVAEARQAVGEYVRARTTGKSSEDVVLFAGNGATGACCQLVGILGVDPDWTVLVGPYEHHSNLLPWRESGAAVRSVGGDEARGLDLDDLARQLEEVQGSSKILGAFSAASNATGRRTDVAAATAVLRAKGALSVWDFATMAPHAAPSASLVDACFFSCHKFLGGVGAPGVLVVKKRLVSASRPPTTPGGGTVFYATRSSHRFVSNRVEREQGGTPNVPGIVRAGAAVRIAARLAHVPLRSVFLAELDGAEWPPSLRLLGARGTDATHLPVFAFMVRCGARWLHHHFVCQLLNDLFGIQCRGGCQCAGPYAHSLLGLDEPLIERALLAHKDSEVLRPGFVRLSLGTSYAHNSPAELRYAARSLALVARYGWRLLPSYRLDSRTGEWRHASRFSKPLGDDRRWFSNALFRQSPRQAASPFSDDDLGRFLAEGERRLRSGQLPTASDRSPLDDALEPLRWFVTPAEASRRMVAEPDALEWRADSSLCGPVRCPVPGRVDVAASALSPEARAAIETAAGATDERLAKKPLRGEAPERSAREGNGPAPPEAPTRVVATLAASKRVKPPKKLLKAVGQAVLDWRLIEEGDKILLGLSGGKDSLSLLHILLHLQRVAPVAFDVACATIDPVTPSFDPSPLIPYVRGLGVPYFYLRDHIVDYAQQIGPASLCSYCARMKRGALYSCALEQGYNKLALGQHLDDLAESFVMNAFHNGTLRSMRAKYVADNGVCVIRPLVYAREDLTADFARSANLPVIGENCPACFEEPKERARTKKLLHKEETIFPDVFNSLRKCLLPLMDDAATEALKNFHLEREESGRRGRRSSRRRSSEGPEQRSGGGSEEE